MPRERSKRLAEMFRIFRMKKRSRKFRESAKPSRRKSKNWPAPANSNTSRNYSRNFRRPSWTCFQFPDSGRRKSKRFTSNSTSARSNNCGKRANPAEWRNCPALAKQRRQRFVRRSSNARNIPDIFNLARLRRKPNRSGEIWRPIPTRSRSMSPEVTGGEGKLCAMSILWWRRKSPRRLRNSSSNTRWWNRSLPKAPRKRACDFAQAFNAIFASSTRTSIRSRSITSPGARNTTSRCAAARCSAAGP